MEQSPHVWRSALAWAVEQRLTEIVQTSARQLDPSLAAKLSAGEIAVALDRLTDLIKLAILDRPLTDRAEALRDLEELGRRTQGFGPVFKAAQTIGAAILSVADPSPAIAEPMRATVMEATFAALAALTDAVAESPDRRVQDATTALIERPVFELALSQEADRAHRHQHPLSLLLLELENLPAIQSRHGLDVADRLLERMSILIRQFFRHHDWVARHGGRSIAVLLPQTALDAATDLAYDLRDIVQERLSVHDDEGNVTAGVRLNAAVVGTDLVESPLDPYSMLASAEDALRRVRGSAGGRVERVPLRATWLSVMGAATALDCTPSTVRRLIREGQLKATHLGRHFLIDPASLDQLRSLKED